MVQDEGCICAKIKHVCIQKLLWFFQICVTIICMFALLTCAEIFKESFMRSLPNEIIIFRTEDIAEPVTSHISSLVFYYIRMSLFLLSQLSKLMKLYCFVVFYNNTCC